PGCSLAGCSSPAVPERRCASEDDERHRRGCPGNLLTNRARPGFPGGCLSLTPREKQLCPNLLISVGGSSVSCKRDDLGPNHPRA
ncbi:hypothetical protein Nmel_017877, partial [Mimus melanotis]